MAKAVPTTGLENASRGPFTQGRGLPLHTRAPRAAQEELPAVTSASSIVIALHCIAVLSIEKPSSSFQTNLADAASS